MAEKAYKFRLYPNKQQEELIRKTCGCARFVYNVTLAVRQAAYKAGAPLSGNDCVKMLPGLKVQYPWLREVDSTALQSSVRNMDRAYQNFFSSKGGSRKGRAIGFPKFKAKHHCRDGFTCKVGFAVQDGAVKLPKLGWIRAKTSTAVFMKSLWAVILVVNTFAVYSPLLSRMGARATGLNSSNLPAGCDTVSCSHFLLSNTQAKYHRSGCSFRTFVLGHRGIAPPPRFSISTKTEGVISDAGLSVKSYLYFGTLLVFRKFSLGWIFLVSCAII